MIQAIGLKLRIVSAIQARTPLGEEPRQHRVDHATDEHGRESGGKDTGESDRANKRRNTEIVAPAVRPFARVAPLKTSIESECDDNWQDRHGNDHSDEFSNYQCRIALID